jgi:hypothetical protein
LVAVGTGTVIFLYVVFVSNLFLVNALVVVLVLRHQVRVYGLGRQAFVLKLVSALIIISRHRSVQRHRFRGGSAELRVHRVHVS